jgi:hypothetical protein
MQLSLLEIFAATISMAIALCIDMSNNLGIAGNGCKVLSLKNQFRENEQYVPK